MHFSSQACATFETLLCFIEKECKPGTSVSKQVADKSLTCTNKNFVGVSTDWATVDLPVQANNIEVCC